MSTLQEIESRAASLSSVDRTRLTTFLLDRLDEVAGIDKALEVCGGEARIVVWMLERFRRSGFSDAELLESYPTLTSEDLRNARLYALIHPDEINRAIREDDAAWDADEAMEQGDTEPAHSGRAAPGPNAARLAVSSGL